MKIDLPLFYPRDGGFVDVVEAELLPGIAPHLASVATFAIHIAGAPDNSWYRDYWFVSNVETGGQVAYERERKHALRNARRKLAEKSPEDVIAAYRRARKAGATK